MRAERCERLRLEPLGQVLSVGPGVEPNRIKTETVCIGEGLTAAFREALSPASPGAKVTDVYCDMNGEPYRADEFGFACAADEGVVRVGVRLRRAGRLLGRVSAPRLPLARGAVDCGVQEGVCERADSPSCGPARKAASGAPRCCVAEWTGAERAGHVKVNGTANSLVHKGSNGISTATIPDVCKTPSPGGPVPIPYPNISQSATLPRARRPSRLTAG